jgi:hypothetical protein
LLQFCIGYGIKILSGRQRAFVEWYGNCKLRWEVQ